MLGVDAGAALTVVLALLAWNGWLHRQLGELSQVNTVLAGRVDSLEKMGTDGTVKEAIRDLVDQVRHLNDRVESDFQRIALCLVQLSNGKQITMAEILRG